MRKPRLFSHDAKGIIPRMSWSPHNLYNLIARSTVPYHSNETSFRKTALTMYQQRWRSKRFLRGYHGEHIPERRFRRWFLPTDLPRLENLKLDGASPASSSSKGVEISGEEKMPIASLFLRDVERRLDVIVHRCCYARSAREGRAMVVQGKVKLNGVKTTDPGTLLNPGDLISVEPSAVPMLSAETAKLADQRKAALMATQGIQEENSVEQEEQTSTSEAETAEGGSQEAAAVEPRADEAEPEGENPAETAAAAATGEGESSEPALSEKAKGKAKANNPPRAKKEEAPLPPGVLPFNLPPYASPFLFIPPYLEASFLTCSAIYLRHPTITPFRRKGRSDRPGETASTSIGYRTDLPSPYPAGGELFTLAWEHYARNAPRIRADIRRTRLEARVGRRGMESARQKDEWKKTMAVRRGWDKKGGSIFISGSGVATRVGGSTPALGKRSTGKASTSGRFLEKGQAKGKGASASL